MHGSAAIFVVSKLPSSDAYSLEENAIPLKIPGQLLLQHVVGKYLYPVVIFLWMCIPGFASLDTAGMANYAREMSVE